MAMVANKGVVSLIQSMLAVPYLHSFGQLWGVLATVDLGFIAFVISVCAILDYWRLSKIESGDHRRPVAPDD